MRTGSTLFLKGVILLLGTAVFAICAFILPLGIISDKTDYYRPILIGLYIPAIPFFIALFHGLKLLGFIDKNIAFSDMSVRALKIIKYCALTISVLFTVGLPYIFYVADLDDAPGVVAIALIIIFASVVIAVFAAVLQRLLQNAIEIKSENELTV